MCGVVGVAFKSVEPSLFDKMTDKMKRRGPDARGTWAAERGPIALGHRRLSIIDLSPSGAQPMADSSGRWMVTFNGEIYNFQVLRQKLEEVGVPFRGHSDSEVLINGISYWGIAKTLDLMNGMFAFAAWDLQDQILYLARDRFGEKPLYYTRIDEAFIFASELKALRLFPGFPREMDPESLELFLGYSYIPAPRTIFKGVFKVQPGYFLKIKAASQIEMQCYWDPQKEAQRSRSEPFDGSLQEAKTEVERLLLESVRMRSISDVPLGCFLSGGIDSSLITAMMCGVSRNKVSSFSIGFEQAGFNEAAYARKVAEHLGTDHTELYVTDQEARDVVPDLPEMFDEPFGDSSQIPMYLVCKMARKAVTVCLSGDAGDELFGGYTRYIQGPLHLRSFSRYPDFLRDPVSRLLQLITPGCWDHLYAGMGWMLPQRFQVLHFGEKLQKLARAIRYSSSPRLFYQNLTMQTDIVPELLQNHGGFNLPEIGWDKDWSVADNMMIQDILGYLPGDILTKVDRASMGVSLESRVPFLDPGLFSFSWSLPMQFKIQKGQGKWILRQILADHIPGSFFERPKSGFAIPIGEWLRGPLKIWADELLPKKEGDHQFLNAVLVQKLWNQHLKGKRDHNAVLWNILMLCAWERSG